MDNMIGERIKARRKELHITLTQIKEQTDISAGNLSCIENGKYLPSAVALIELSRILDCSIDWILTGKCSISESDNISDIEHSKDRLLLSHFHTMSSEDQDELLMIAEIKANKATKKGIAISSHSESDNAIA